MIIDHLGAMFFEDLSILRIIGRGAFIIYAYLISEGFFHTKNVKKYISKLFIWALVSEVPFDYANYGVIYYPAHQNIFWTLFISATTIYLLEKNKEVGLKVLICSISLFIALIGRVDYSIYGVGVILAFYLSRKAKVSFILPIIFLNIIASFLLNKLQIYSLIGLMIVLMYNGEQGKKTGNIYYSFYALHLGLFGIIKYLIIN